MIEESEMAEEKRVNQLFDTQLVCDISVACIVSYLINEGHEDENSIDVDKIADFINNNITFIATQVLNQNGQTDAEKKTND